MGQTVIIVNYDDYSGTIMQ